MKKVILGLDVSTSKVGLCIMDYKFNLLETQFIKLNTKDTLEERCIFLEDYINRINYLNNIGSKGYLIEDVVVESAFIAFSGDVSVSVKSKPSSSSSFGWSFSKSKTTSACFSNCLSLSVL